MTLMFGDETPNVFNLKRFRSKFGPSDKGQTRNLGRPDDFQAIFEGDTNEDFKIGIKITKGSMKVCEWMIYSVFVDKNGHLGSRTIKSSYGYRRVIPIFSRRVLMVGDMCYHHIYKDRIDIAVL